MLHELSPGTPSLPGDLWMLVFGELFPVMPLVDFIGLSRVNSSWLKMVYESVTELNTFDVPALTDDALARLRSRLTNLRGLYLRDSEMNFDGSIVGMTNLTSLALGRDFCSRTVCISDETLSSLLNLTELDISHDKFISDMGIRNLTNLTALGLAYSSQVSDEGLQRLVQLKSLVLFGNVTISDNGICKLTNLIDLRVNGKITDQGISQLASLTCLDITGNENLSDASLGLFTNLSTLLVGAVPPKLTESGIRRLTNLTKLHVRDESVDSIVFHLAALEMPKLRDLALDCMDFRDAFATIPSLEILYTAGETYRRSDWNFYLTI